MQDKTKVTVTRSGQIKPYADSVTEYHIKGVYTLEEALEALKLSPTEEPGWWNPHVIPIQTSYDEFTVRIIRPYTD